MRRVEAILAASMAFSLTGCVLRGKPQTANAIPVAPKPVSAPAPAQPPPPLSIPQTQVELPPPQPLSTEAQASAQPQEETTSTPAPPTRPPRSRPSAASPRTEIVGPSLPAGPPPSAEAPRATIQEIVPIAEQNRLQAEAQKSRKVAQGLLEQLRRHRLTPQQQNTKDRVLSFLKLSEQAEQHGDMRKAYDLAENGVVLAKELPGGR